MFKRCLKLKINNENKNILSYESTHFIEYFLTDRDKKK